MHKPCTLPPPSCNSPITMSSEASVLLQPRNFHEIIFFGGGGRLDEQNLSFTILLFLRLSEYLVKTAEPLKRSKKVCDRTYAANNCTNKHCDRHIWAQAAKILGGGRGYSLSSMNNIWYKIHVSEVNHRYSH